MPGPERRNDDLESQINRNLAIRVAAAAGVIALVIGLAKGREPIVRQATRAIRKLPGFYDTVSNRTQFAYLRIFQTEDPELAEQAFSLLMDPSTGRGRERFFVNQNSVGFMTPKNRCLEEAVAARSRIPGVFTVLSSEIDLQSRQTLYALYLTSRRLELLTGES